MASQEAKDIRQNGTLPQEKILSGKLKFQEMEKAHLSSGKIKSSLQVHRKLHVMFTASIKNQEKYSGPVHLQ